MTLSLFADTRTFTGLLCCQRSSGKVGIALSSLCMNRCVRHLQRGLFICLQVSLPTFYRPIIVITCRNEKSLLWMVRPRFVMLISLCIVYLTRGFNTNPTQADRKPISTHCSPRPSVDWSKILSVQLLSCRNGWPTESHHIKAEIDHNNSRSSYPGAEICMAGSQAGSHRVWEDLGWSPNSRPERCNRWHSRTCKDDRGEYQSNSMASDVLAYS